ncbi:MAG: hypothetical protein AMJ84_03725 [Acidithiobacillales bacterium SM23_46]|nr:MAG: hypothetical protein AMJ84_03725 [Acidithiobacillales bacterium SM23_46]
MAQPTDWPDHPLNVLTLDRFMSVEDLIERIVGALHDHRPFGLVRWGDGENRIIEEGRYDPQAEFRHIGNFLTLRNYIPFRQRFLAGIARADVLGFFPNDYWTCRVLHRHEIDVARKPFVYAWCNRHWNARREWTDEVLKKPWRTVLAGNRMAEYRPWVEQRFPLKIVATFPARDWLDVDHGCARLAEWKPQLVLVSAGWYAPVIVEAAKMASGSVAIDYGHCPDYHMDRGGAMLPNTCCPRGPAGCRQHYAHGNFADAIHQERDINLPTDQMRPATHRMRRRRRPRIT